MPAEFTCAECGRRRLSLTEDAPPAAGLCIPCAFYPGWFREAAFRAVLDPGHDGLEAIERAPPLTMEL